jgi:hypothetical protein
VTLLLDLFFTRRGPAWFGLLATLTIEAVILLVAYGSALAIGRNRTVVTPVVLFVDGVVLGVAQ